MSFTYESDNVKDNEKRKFQPDTVGNVAVNIKSTDLANLLSDILDALLGAISTVPNVSNVACPVANTEYSFTLPTDCKRFVLKARKSSKLSFAYSPGASEVLTIDPGVSYEDKSFYASQTIYFRCSKADEVVEVATFV